MALDQTSRPYIEATPEETVTAFLQALQDCDFSAVRALLAPDLAYTNVSLPTLRGGERVARMLELALRRGGGFEVETHHIAVNGDTVLTERTDVVKLGPVHARFWVCGTFQVRDGQIVVWRDYFDWMALSRGVVRGIIGAVLPWQRLHRSTRPR
ncbi:limonene-1,2-epoxide hydrolase family protein [Algiphilus sp.]|uniref:limonene-1,2-epoxide hydrolase family protein n=1 Tax=Algiphilus sp. TaxID=1872431 RepID=UPI003B51A9E4